MLELYHHGSSACAAKVRFALAEKDLEWKSHYIDILAGEQFDESYLKINPKAIVPTLVHDGKIIPESTVICEYVEGAFPETKHLYPADPYLLALIRIWTKAVDEELHPSCSALTYVLSHRHTILRNGIGSFEDFLKAGSEQDGITYRTLKWQWIQQGLEAPGAADKIRLYDGYLHKMEKALQNSDWLVGNAFTIADVALAPYLNRLAALDCTGMWRHGRLPNVERWFDRISSRPTFAAAFIQWVPEGLTLEMRTNGAKSWPQVKKILSI